MASPGRTRRKQRSRPAFYVIIGIIIALSAIKSRAGNVQGSEKEGAGKEGAGKEGAGEEEKDKIPIVVTPTTATETQNSTNRTESDPLACPSGRHPAIEQFPRPWMSQNIRMNGGIGLYIAATAYTFLAVAIICDEFFVPSLEILCDVLKISPDVAGATFMAAGSSAPELATAVIGVFVAHNDIGVSGVIGSAVFNIMFVISLCGLVTTEVLYLNWWPLVRDCFFYMISILALLGTIADETIDWYESVILLVLYGVYCYVMYINDLLEAWANTLPVPFPVHVPQGVINEEKELQKENAQVVSYKSVVVGGEDGTVGSETETQTTAATGVTSDVGSEGGKKVHGRPTETILSQFEPPTSGWWKKFLWHVSLPLIYLLYYTVPDCRMDKWRTWYLVTFALAMIWIAIFSYFMVWFITVIGFTVGIPDTVMGLTFVAAGVSVPDALSSLAVLKDGQGDMAVSNAVGSNVFDILVCLGLPWFLSTTFNPGKSVQVHSKGLVYSTLSLLSTVAFLLIATHYNGWKLDKKYGIILMMWYIFFIVFASLYELNIFADWHPKECGSSY